MPTTKSYQRRHRAENDTFVPTLCTNEGAWLRYHHKDIPDLELEQLWAEMEVLSAELARRIYADERPYWLGSDHAISDREWLRGRIARLRAELRQRQSDQRSAA